jgi:hypothetical protein
VDVSLAPRTTTQRTRPFSNQPRRPRSLQRPDAVECRPFICWTDSGPSTPENRVRWRPTGWSSAPRETRQGPQRRLPSPAHSNALLVCVWSTLANPCVAAVDKGPAIAPSTAAALSVRGVAAHSAYTYMRFHVAPLPFAQAVDMGVQY